jgi:hypothetical protein
MAAALNRTTNAISMKSLTGRILMTHMLVEVSRRLASPINRFGRNCGGTQRSCVVRQDELGRALPRVVHRIHKPLPKRVSCSACCSWGSQKRTFSTEELRKNPKFVANGARP